MTENNRTTEIGLNGQLNDVVNEMQTMQKSLEMFQSNMVQRLKIFRKVTEDYFRDSTGRLSVINQFFDLSLDKPEKRADKHPHTFKTGLDAIGNRLEDLSKQIDSHYVTINKRLDTLDQRFVTLEKDVGFMKQRFHTIGGHLEGLDSRFNNLGVRLDSQFSNMEENLDALESPFDAIEKRFNLLDERFDDIEQSLDDLDPRFASLEQNYTAIDPKLESLGHRLDSVTRFDALRQPLADIKQCFHPLVQHNDNFKLHFDSSIQSIHKNIDQRSCVSEQCSNAINGIAVDIVREVQGLKIEIRAGCLYTHFLPQYRCPC